jgi:hypothetical protein
MGTDSASNRAERRTFGVLLALNVLATIAHYTDNVLRFSAYPEPSWDNARLTDAFWFVMTPFALAAYLLHAKGKRAQAAVAAYAYAAMSLLVLGHYLYAPPWAISVPMNAGILAEATLAVALAAYAMRMRPVKLEGYDDLAA